VLESITPTRGQMMPAIICLLLRLDCELHAFFPLRFPKFLEIPLLIAYR
jgi:hypothetical protein